MEIIKMFAIFFFDNLYPESGIHDVAAVVVWNVLVGDENNSVNRPSMN